MCGACIACVWCGVCDAADAGAPHGVICAAHGERGAPVACGALSICVFGECVGLVACNGDVSIECGLVALPIGQVVGACDVHGTVGFSKGECT